MYGSRINNDVRMAFPFAVAEAQDLGQPSLGPEHLLLGILCSARDPLTAVLADHQITLATAREAVRAVPRPEADEPGADADRAERDRYDEDRDALAMLGIDLDRVRAAVKENFGDDLAAGWGSRGQRRGRGGRGGEGHRGHRGGPHGRHGGPRGGGPGWGGPGDGEGRRRRGGAPWGEGPRGEGPRGRGEGDSGPWDGDGGPWEYGRGRRGPRGHGRRPRLTPSAKQAVGEAIRLAGDQGYRAASTAHVAAALLAVDDPAVAAIIALAPDADALRQAVADQIAATAQS